MTTNGSFIHQEQYKSENEQYATAPNPTETKTDNLSKNDLNKDEVGWYFVEQFYTTMSKEPDRLHLFYGTNSQLVYGLEAQITTVSVGREAIQERIKKLNFQDTKVRLSNVDSQASYDCIVIQVIGEISHLSMEPKKFVETFILAQQRNGYFVLNDIFRYIIEDVAEEKPLENHTEESNLAASQEVDLDVPKEKPTVQEQVLSPVSKTANESLDKETMSQEIPVEVSRTTNGARVNDSPTPPVEASITNTADEKLVSESNEKPSEEEPKVAENPKEAPPTLPTIRLQNETKPATSAQSTGPPKPLSWASRAAAAVGSTPKPAVPVVAPKNSIPAQNWTASASTKTAPVTNTTPSLPNEKGKGNVPLGTGWQTAGENPKKQSRPQSVSTPPEKESTQGYVRNVTDKVDADALRTVLSSFGTLLYFDVNRFKNCAFVEFATTEGYQAATNASPHQVSGESIFVEPRRPKSNPYGGNGYSGGGRAGINQRSRGSFGNRGRGSGTPSRGRGQASNA